MSPEDRRLRAQLGAFSLHASGRANTAPGRLTFMGRFEREVRDRAAAQGETLDDATVAKRVGYLKQAYFTRLALASHVARAPKRKAAGSPPTAA